MKNINGNYLVSSGSILSIIGIGLFTFKLSPILYTVVITLGLLCIIAGVLIKAKKNNTYL